MIYSWVAINYLYPWNRCGSLSDGEKPGPSGIVMICLVLLIIGQLFALSLVPRLYPTFRCCTRNKGRAWYLKSCAWCLGRTVIIMHGCILYWPTLKINLTVLCFEHGHTSKNERLAIDTVKRCKSETNYSEALNDGLGSIWKLWRSQATEDHHLKCTSLFQRKSCPTHN